MDRMLIAQDTGQERYALAIDRIRRIPEENTTPEPYRDFFLRTAHFILLIDEIREDGPLMLAEGRTGEEWAALNRKLYEDILPDNYACSYGNPDYAVQKLGEGYGQLLSFLYAEIRGMIGYVFEGKSDYVTMFAELFIEIYNCFEADELPKEKELGDILYWFMSDNSDILAADRILEQIDPKRSPAVKLIENADLDDLSYLYRFGEYVSENELQTAEHLNSLSEEEIQAMADTFTEGYRIGFVRGGKDLSIKSTVNIRYNLGFERVVRAAIKNFGRLGLEPVIYRAAQGSMNRRQQHRIGYTGAIANKQYDYDHKDDNVLYLDKKFIERKLSVIRTTYEDHKELAAGFAGPAVMEIFGETPFTPETKSTALSLSDKQQKLSVYYDSQSGQITNEYIHGEERSFTIIAYPIPEIGKDYKEIFDEVVKINTLDYELYERIQQALIDTLDQAEYVHIKGGGVNCTDLKVSMQKLSDPEHQTNFENCVADVNIPVGEVFTSPELQGTDGILYVSQVYLNELKYDKLKIELKDGRVSGYTCGNFEKEEENRKYIRENILYNHESLPIGEFAIGTNTTAYVMAEKYGIASRLPILIAEKMGPHFALGDTCYSWSEDNKVYNPDGKEIMAKDNECSVLRKTDVSRAYFNCHTDITIPYEELAFIRAVKRNEEEISIIENGRFVLPGTEELNRPFGK